MWSAPRLSRSPFCLIDRGVDLWVFPTGRFIGVYFSEELKYARTLGYTVVPTQGYLFEKGERSPFKDFVSSLSESRLRAREEGNEAIAYVLKILMNALYGRFGISPESTTAEICDNARWKELIHSHEEFLHGVELKENTNLATYRSYTGPTIEKWRPLRNAAVQMAAAAAAYPRMHMDPIIRNNKCYYTDTDSVVLGHPLPDELLSPSVLGKFKLEDKIEKGLFLAPKAYWYQPKGEAEPVVKFKGPAKAWADTDRFESQYADPSRIKVVEAVSHFRGDWNNLTIRFKKTPYRLGIRPESKRKPIRKDGTFNQEKALHLHRLRVKKLRKLYSFDLKSATDCWPLSVIYSLMSCMWGSTLASSIVNSTLGLNTFLLTKPFVKGISEVAFLTGQPLAYYGSWSLFALSHHYLLWLAAKKAYPQRATPFYD